MSRLWNLVKGFFGLFVRNLENANPQAMLESEMNSFVEAVGAYNSNLAKQAGMVYSLKEQTKREKKELDDLIAKTTALVAAKQTERAGQLALDAKNRKTSYDENVEQLKQAEEMYQSLTRQRDVYVKEAKTRLENIKNKISKAEMAEAQAKMAEIASAMTFDMSGSGANLDRLEKGLDERISEAKGKVRVAGDSMKSGGFEQIEAEQKAMEAAALAEFTASMGISSPTAEEAPKVEKDLA